MKIAWMLPNLHLTGGARVAVELSDRMVERGHRFHIMIPSGRRKLPWLCRAEVIECGPPVKSPLFAVPVGLTAMATRLPRVDLIVASMPPYALLARKVGRWRRIPTVNYVLNDDVHFFDDRSFIRNVWMLSLYRSMARRSIRRTPLIVNSHWTAVRCVAEGGSRPMAIVPHGFNPDIFYPRETPLEPEDTARLVTIGRHVRWKGLAELIEALNLVHRQHYPFRLRVISQDELDLSPAQFPVELVKPVDDLELAEFYRSSELFIHSSWFEGFGMPPLEAQACGLAVVATDSGGVREFLRDGDNAVMVPPREPRTLARAIQRLIEDADQRGRLAARGLQTCTEFSWELATDRFEAALKMAIETC